ncbi:ferritin family protein [Candidatus Woesearchaeota archaeon]|nr:ferritin family protein [Candidatus Woesearchaeota archaeon]
MSDDLMKWIRYAINTEEKGLKFYMECREKVRHPRGAELFDFLIKAEIGHKRVLTELLSAVSKGDDAKLKQSVKDFLAIKAPNPLFDRDSLERLTRPDAQITAMFNKAIEFEEVGIDLYTDYAKETDSKDLKRLFLRLANDEKTHRRELVDLGHFVFGMPAPSEIGELEEEGSGA